MTTHVTESRVQTRPPAVSVISCLLAGGRHKAREAQKTRHKPRLNLSQATALLSSRLPSPNEEEKQSSMAADETRKNKGGLDSEWELERHYEYDDLEREMTMLMAADNNNKQQQRRRRHRPDLDLLQNCDLPPPAKLFGPVPTLQRLELELETAAAAKDHKQGDDDLLRALRLSQSRAREAEDKLAAAGATTVDLAALLVRDSVALSAHRRWVMMLEADNSLLRGRDAGPDNGAAGGVAAWWVALAVCVGVAGVGLALRRFLC